MDTIYFRNKAQKVLYDKEIRGQISDGVWENEETDRRLWYCKTVVNSKKVGANWKPKPKLDFADALEWLSDRMIDYVLKSGVRKHYTFDDLVQDLEDMTLITFELDPESK